VSAKIVHRPFSLWRSSGSLQDKGLVASLSKPSATFLPTLRATLARRFEFTRALARPVPYAIALALFAVLSRGEAIDPRAANRSASLVSVLSARGFACDEADVTWVNGPHGVKGSMLGGSRALVRARLRASQEPSDLYLAETRLSPEGVLLDVGTLWNLTHSAGVDEARPLLQRGARRGTPEQGAERTFVATSTSLDGVVKDVHVIDLLGQPPALYTDFTPLQRWQTALTNLQQTGQTSGVVHQVFELDPPASHVDLSWAEARGGAGPTLTAVADNRRVVIDVERGAVIEGGGWTRTRTDGKAPPGRLVTWAVDRVRALPWFGEEKMQVVKAVAFTALDYVMRVRASISPDSTEQDVARDLAGLGQHEPVFTDPELGWPPAPMKPIVTPPLPGEGAWISLERDPFIRQTQGVPSPFVTSFVRADKARHETRVYVTLWDPRQIALHMQAGTVEPVSATGEAGPGEVPRTPEVFSHLVAGFNGGFQAMHGEYGMEANGVVYLPPKPYAATVLEMKDGSTAFGAWPEGADVGEDVLSFRQNLTALVQDDRFNPWGRTWWGGTPKGWQDEVHTTRSGICLTKENFVGYFWGNDISADILANAMLAARCAFGLHLDMNAGHAGFEFFNAQPKDEFLPLGRPLQQDWEFEGTLKSMPDFRVRARRMVKGMGHMNFPRGCRFAVGDHAGGAGRRRVARKGAPATRVSVCDDDHVDASDGRATRGQGARASRRSAHGACRRQRGNDGGYADRRIVFRIRARQTWRTRNLALTRAVSRGCDIAQWQLGCSRRRTLPRRRGGRHSFGNRRADERPIGRNGANLCWDRRRRRNARVDRARSRVRPQPRNGRRRRCGAREARLRNAVGASRRFASLSGRPPGYRGRSRLRDGRNGATRARGDAGRTPPVCVDAHRAAFRMATASKSTRALFQQEAARPDQHSPFGRRRAQVATASKTGADTYIGPFSGDGLHRPRGEPKRARRTRSTVAPHRMARCSLSDKQ